MNVNKIYLCIDLKTFYASVECVERNLDPFQTHLVVADPSRGKGALCLAVSPRMKQLGVRNRCRLFEIPKDIQYEIALPRMNLYMEYSAHIYSIYLQYVSHDDIHVYSIDECFIDVTPYLHLYQLTAEQLAKKIINDVYQQTGITATVGIGTNLYLAKIALDITAKHVKDNIGYLDEELYQRTLWYHTPLTDFWQIGKGIQKRLSHHGIYDMYDIAHCDENILYQEFGVNAEYLIDHAWGFEPTTIADIKKYEPQSHSVSNSQILFEDYCYKDALLVLKEMVELNVLTLIERHLVCDCIALYVGYSKDVRKATGGQRKLTTRTNSLKILMNEFIDLFQQKTSHDDPIRQISLSFGNVVDEKYESYDLFTDYESLAKEKRLQQAFIEIQHKYGKNAVLKGMNYFDKATTRKRNLLVGGHNAQ